MTTAQLSQIFTETFSPEADVRRRAESNLNALQTSPAFAQIVLSLTADESQAKPIRQAAALAFKNWIKTNWGIEDAPSPIASEVEEQLKGSIISYMISLSNSPALQVQIGEGIAIMAEADFPDRWNNLVDQLVGSLNPADWVVNNSVFQTAHSIFKNWRSQFRTDKLFTEIKLVLDKFCEPYLAVFTQIDVLLSDPNLPQVQRQVLHKTLHLTLQLYYDLNSQDLPEFFEDRLAQFMPLLLKYLEYGPAPVDQDEDDEEIGELELVKTAICEITTLYAQRYLDAFGDYLGPFVEKTWSLLTTLGKAVKYDTLVAKAVGFLSVVAKMPSQKELFNNKEILEQLCEKIILPSMTLRTFEEDMFQDDPAEYVRRDLESFGSETRRQAASDFTKALMEQFDRQITDVVTRYITNYLTQYNADKVQNWKCKDTAIFLLTSIASRGSTVAQGVISTNSLVDVVQFFSDHVMSDLQAPVGSVSPIVQADAIKYLYTFRNQLTKAQLLTVLPMLIPHLGTESYVIHTYAATTIERILFIKENNVLIVSQADLKPYALQILESLFRRIESGTTPQQIASNDSLMKCVMRIIVTARQSLADSYQVILQHLIQIVQAISQNPSNPKFNHFTFEAISGLTRFVTAADPSTLQVFEAQLFPPFQTILAGDIVEFTPFVFQILSQLLESQPTRGISGLYQILLQPILSADLWSQRGNVPALVRLLRAFLMKGASSFTEQQYFSVLGIFQHLINTKTSDGYGFELLDAMYEFVAPATMDSYMTRPVFISILDRLQKNKTDKFVQLTLRFICFASAIQRNNAPPAPDAVIKALDNVQPNSDNPLFVQLMDLLLKYVQKMPIKDRKVVAVGLTNMLAKSDLLLQPPLLRIWTPMMEAVLKLFLLPGTLSLEKKGDDLDLMDPEDIGYQTSFSRLGASEKTAVDPVAYVPEPRGYLATALVERSRSRPGVITPLITAVTTEFSRPFLTYLTDNHFTLN